MIEDLDPILGLDNEPERSHDFGACGIPLGVHHSRTIVRALAAEVELARL